MASFYERLGVDPGANIEDVTKAYHRGLARLVKKLRKAAASNADTAVLEAERHALMQAYEVVSEPARRRRYDHYLKVEGEDLPTEAGAFWSLVNGGMIDPATSSAIGVLRAITKLRVGQEAAPAVEVAPAPAPVEPPLEQYEIERTDPVSSAAAHIAPVIEQAVPVQSVPEQRSFRLEAVMEPMVEPTVAPRELTPQELDRMQMEFGFDGRYIAAVREARGFTIDGVAEMTRISSRYLTAIETNAFERLPSSIFVKGYLREIARVLDIEADQLADGYLGLYRRQRG